MSTSRDQLNELVDLASANAASEAIERFAAELDTQVRLWQDLAIQFQISGNEPGHLLCRDQAWRYMDLRCDLSAAKRKPQPPYTPQDLLTLAGTGQWATIAALTQFRDSEVHEAAWRVHSHEYVRDTPWWRDMVREAEVVVRGRVAA